MSNGVSNKTAMWIVAGAAVLVVGGLLALFQGTIDGHIVYDKSDAALYCVHNDQCERPGSGKLIAETQNTFSNLAYLFFGVCVLVRAFRSGAPAPARPGPVMFGLALCFLAVFSGYYHATLNFDGTTTAAGVLRLVDNLGRCAPTAQHRDSPQLLDIVGVYMVLIVLFLYGIDRLLWKNVASADTKSKIVAIAVGVGLPLVLIVVSSALGGGSAGIGLTMLLAIFSAFVLGAHFAGKYNVPWLMWSIWAVLLLLIGFLAVLMKTELHWDSTWIFLLMAGLLATVLVANWSFAVNPVPWPEFIALGTVFLLGGAPRVLDGYGWDDQLHRLFRRDFCSPDGFVQAHALWHMISALALALTFDLLEKSRQVTDEGSPGTILLPQGNDLSNTLGLPLSSQSAGAIVFNVLLSAASLLLLILVLVNYNYDHSGLGILLLAFVPIIACTALWLWPFFHRSAP